MSLGLYAAATGLEAQNTSLAVIANNLANISTTAFKRSTVEFKDLVYEHLRPQGGDVGGGSVVPSSIELGSGVQVSSTTKIFTPGEFKSTNNQFDMAINGDGFFEVKMPDGSIAYTRDGALKTGPKGDVTTSDGFLLQSGFQPIDTGASVFISEGGQVTAISDTGTKSFQIQLARFANPAGLQSIGNNLYVETPASGTPQVGSAGTAGLGRLLQKHLEMSNVNVTEEMVNMIVAQRTHEAGTRAIQAGDEMMQRSNQIKK